MRKFWNLHAWQNHRAAVAAAVVASKYHTVPCQTIPTRQRLGCATQQYDPAAPKKDAAAARRNATHAPEAAPDIYAAARYGGGEANRSERAACGNRSTTTWLPPNQGYQTGFHRRHESRQGLRLSKEDR